MRPALLCLLVLASLALRLYRLDFQDIWWDEARNIDVASRPLAEIAGAPELDIHPPIYFYLLHGWIRLAGRTAFAIRFLSLWFGVLLVPLMDRLGRRVGGPWVGFGAALVTACSPFLVGEAQEARMYTVTLVWLVVAGIQVAGVRSQIAGRKSQIANHRSRTTGHESRSTVPKLQVPDRKSIFAIHHSRFVLLALFSALALLTHYAAVFALIALWGWAAGWALIGSGQARWGRAAQVGLAAVGTALLCLPGLPVALRQIPSYRNPNLNVPTVAAYLAELARVYSTGEHLDPDAARPWQVLLATVIVGGLLLALWSLISRRASRSAPVGPHLQQDQTAEGATASPTHQSQFTIRHSPFAIGHWLFALLWAILPLIVYYLVIRSRSTFASRYIAFAFPGWLLLAGLALWGWASAPARFRALGLRSGAQRSRPRVLGVPTPLETGSGEIAGASPTLEKAVGSPPRIGGAAGTAWSHLMPMLAGLGIVVALVPGVRADLTDARYYREDTSGLADWLLATTTPQDLILVDQRYPFGFYYPRWNNQADGFPPAEPADLAPAQYLFVDINTIADRLTSLARHSQRVFWVRWFESDTDPRGAVSFLLEKYGTELGSRAFRGYSVSWYEIALDTRFELASVLTPRPVDFDDQVRLAAIAFGGRGAGPTSTLAETRQPITPADGAVWVVARWARLPGASAKAKATLFLEDEDGLIVGRDDRRILNDRHLAPTFWGADDQPLGVYLVHPDPGTPPGRYTLKLAVYDADTLAQWPAAGPGAAGTTVALGQVRLTRATEPPANLSLDRDTDFAWGGVRLLGRGALPRQVSPGGVIPLDLYWQATRAGLPDLLVRLALMDEVDRLSSTVETAPVRGIYPTTRWAADEVVRDHHDWRLDPQTPAGSYRIVLALSDPTGRVSPEFELGRVTVTGRSHVFETPKDIGEPVSVLIGDFARLLGFRPAVLAATPGETLRLELYWRAEGASTVPYTVFVHMLDGNGVLRAQRDQQPGDGAFPTTGWVPGEILTDTYRIEIPADLPTARYSLVVGMYDPTTGQRLSVVAPDGRPVGDTLPLTTVMIR